MNGKNGNKETEVSSLLIVGTLLFIVMCEALAQSCVKKCKLTDKWHFYLLAVFFYAMVCLGLYRMYGFKNMGVVNLMWSCLSIVSIITVGVIFFHEEINRYDILGMIFVFMGLGLVFMKGH